MKPHRGTIYMWSKVEHPIIKEMYPESLGYKIKGIPQGHSEFVNWILTSPVVKQEGCEIETLNSRYTLVAAPSK
jgi:hypothetical protein